MRQKARSTKLRAFLLSGYQFSVQESLFGSESLDGIEARGAPGGQQAGDDRNDEQQPCNLNEYREVECFGLVEHRLDEANHRGASRKPKGESDKCGPDSIQQHKS